MAHLFLLGIVYLSFISLGLPDAVIGVAWPAIRQDMSQPLAAVGVLTIIITLCAAASSWLSGRLIQRMGTGVVTASSCLMTALALLGFSLAPSFGWLVAMVIPMGLGAGAVDAGLNQFVAAHYTSRHMNWLHGFWGVGAATGPIIMGLALAGEGGWAGGVRHIGYAQLVLALVLWSTLALWRHHPRKPAGSIEEAGRSPLRFQPVAAEALWLSPAAFLLYVAAEMGTYLWTASILVTNRGVALPQAGVWVSVYFGAITLGRFSAGMIANRLGNRRMVALGVSLATAGASLFALPWLPNALNLAGLVLMGLGCAPIFPSLMHETARRFPADVARKVIGWQMMAAYAGGSVIPAAFGLLATWLGLGAVMPTVVGVLVMLSLVVRRLNQLT